MDEKQCILIVDDDKSTLRTLKLIFEKKGYQIETAMTGQEGLDKAQARPFNLALLDIKLPDMAGVALLAPLKKMHPDIAIIVATAHASLETAVQAVNGGASAYIAKPLDMDEVLITVREALAKQRLIVENRQLYQAAQRELTERKRVEEALRELNATLEAQVAARTAEIRAEQEKSETILRSVGDAILMADLKMRIQYVNEAYTTLTGYTAEEVLGQLANSIGAGTSSRQVQQAIELALSRGEVWQGEVIGRRKDGRSYDAALTVAPVRDGEGRIVGYVSSHRDISRLKELERARNRFMTNVSHELRTPVTNMRLYAQLLRMSRRAEKTEGYLQVLEQEATRLSELIQDVLEMTELDSGRAAMAWKPVSPPTIIGDAVTRYQSQAELSNLTLVAATVPPGLPAAKGDQVRLTRALCELVQNAVTFTPSGGQVIVEAGIAENGKQSYLTFSVRDTGPGISAEEQEKVFDRFYRGSLAESGHVPGTGLGLSIAQEILRAHGGRVTVESKVGEGSTFCMWLPLE